MTPTRAFLRAIAQNLAERRRLIAALVTASTSRLTWRPQFSASTSPSTTWR